MKIGIVGIGKLGLCFALNLEKSGFEIVGIDVSQEYVDSINNKTLISEEPLVEELLKKQNNFLATTKYEDLADIETVFILVATPSLPDGSYDHTQVEAAFENILALKKENAISVKNLVIGCTTMPGYCNSLQMKIDKLGLEMHIAYNPEFIAQGTVIRDQIYPDMILIGANDEKLTAEIVSVYEKLVMNSPKFALMSPLEAEITKIALNCFLTTKIAYANMVGDVAIASGADPKKILSAIGADSRIGEKYLKYGYGFGGPCFPRDNRAFAIHADSVGIDAKISKSTDESNRQHLKFQTENLLCEDEFYFDSVTYKPESTLLVESQQLALAVNLADAGKKVHITERKYVIEQLKNMYGEKFIYTERDF
jgi:nucleotide sugar dehydrogenase